MALPQTCPSVSSQITNSSCVTLITSYYLVGFLVYIPNRGLCTGGLGKLGAQGMSAVVTRAPFYALPLPHPAHSCHYTLFLEIERWRALN